MINWISSKDENNYRKVNYDRLISIMNFVKSQNPSDEMTRYVCEIFEEYKNILNNNPNSLKNNLINGSNGNFIIDGNINSSGIIISPSDLNSYFTIKELNKNKKDITIVCFDMHSDTYDYNDFLWKGNSFSRLMKEGYINHYVVIGVPKEKRSMCIEDTNEDLRNRVHLIEESELFETLGLIDSKNLFISIDADCFNCRKAKYTAIEYSPSTILNYVSHSDNINEGNYVDKMKQCVHVKNELGYSNYYHTGENNITVEDVVRIVHELYNYCISNNIKLGIEEGQPFYQLMEVSGYDYGNLTSNMVFKLIDGLDLMEVKEVGKKRILKKN